MTLQVVAGWLGQSGIQHPAKLYRNMLAGITGRRTGAFRYGDFTLTPSGSAMSMAIGRGDMYLHGTESVTDQGGYFVWNNASETLAWPAAAAQPRIDTLVLRVIDTDYGADAAGSKATWEIVSGTPAASPTAVPDSAFAPAGAFYHPGAWVRVADVTVPGGVTNLSTATLSQTLRYVRQGRAQVVGLYGQEPTDPQRGDLVQYNSGAHSGVMFNYTGTAWVPAGSMDWKNWSPVVRNNAISGTQTVVGSTTDYARYKQVGDMIFWQMSVAVTGNASNGGSVTLPVSAANRSFAAGSLWVVGSGAATDQVGMAYHGGSAGAWDRLHVIGPTNSFRDFPSGTNLRGYGFYHIDK
jgi:hypothetical protein